MFFGCIPKEVNLFFIRPAARSMAIRHSFSFKSPGKGLFSSTRPPLMVRQPIKLFTFDGRLLFFCDEDKRAFIRLEEGNWMFGFYYGNSFLAARNVLNIYIQRVRECFINIFFVECDKLNIHVSDRLGYL